MSTIESWEPKHLTGDDHVELRVHNDGYVMWHRVGCNFGAKHGALEVTTTEPLEHALFRAALEVTRQSGEERQMLFCGACLVHQPREITA